MNRHLRPLLVAVAAIAGLASLSWGPRTTASHGVIQIVAHQDDDLLFMNPDIMSDLRAGKHVTTVYLTAGDADLGENYWRGREAGIRAAYALMAGSENEWKEEEELVAGKKIHAIHLASAPNARVYFLRLPDGKPTGEGFESTGFQSLEKLWEGSIADIRAVDGSARYTRAELIETLKALLVSAGGTRTQVRSLNPTQERSFDHSDHRYSALFAGEASPRHPEKAAADPSGLSVSEDPVNLHPVEQEGSADLSRVRRAQIRSSVLIRARAIRRKLPRMARAPVLRRLVEQFLDGCSSRSVSVSTSGLFNQRDRVRPEVALPQLLRAPFLDNEKGLRRAFRLVQVPAHAAVLLETERLHSLQGFRDALRVHGLVHAEDDIEVEHAVIEHPSRITFNSGLYCIFRVSTLVIASSSTV